MVVQKDAAIVGDAFEALGSSPGVTGGSCLEDNSLVQALPKTQTRIGLHRMGKHRGASTVTAPNGFE